MRHAQTVKNLTGKFNKVTENPPRLDPKRPVENCG